MAKFVTGQVVVVTFPFSNLQGQKLRPALVLAQAEFDNLILCQITSKPYSSKKAIRITPDDFTTGKLPITSYARPDKLFTAETTIIHKTIGKLTSAKTAQILDQVTALFQTETNNEKTLPQTTS